MFTRLIGSANTCLLDLIGCFFGSDAFLQTVKIALGRSGKVDLIDFLSHIKQLQHGDNFNIYVKITYF